MRYWARAVQRGSMPRGGEGRPWGSLYDEVQCIIYNGHIGCLAPHEQNDSLPVEVGVPDPAVGTFLSVSAVFLFRPDLDGGDGSLSEESKTAAEDEKSNLWLKTGCSPLDGAL